MVSANRLTLNVKLKTITLDTAHPAIVDAIFLEENAFLMLIFPMEIMMDTTKTTVMGIVLRLNSQLQQLEHIPTLAQ